MKLITIGLAGTGGFSFSRTPSNEKNIFTSVKNKSLGNTFVSSDFLAVAKRVWNEVCTRFTTYGGVSSIPPTGSTIDCSAYVSWVLYEYGYTEITSQINTEKFYNTNWNQKYGWTEIPIASRENVSNKVQPGDLLLRYGEGTHHIQIIAKIENGIVYVYDCGDTRSWTGEWGGGPSCKPATYTDFLSLKGAGKIIRVTPPQ